MKKSHLLYQGKNSRIEVDTENQKIFKKLKQEYPSEAEIQRLRNEYDILRGKTLDGVRQVARYDKENQQYELILEYIKGDNLDNFFRKETLNLVEKIQLFIQLVQIIGRVHQAGIIHKDLNPSNILITEAQKIYVIDFGISSKFTLRNPHLGNPETLEGTLAYISPEQTGRMNRSIDYRTDFYALGVIFYQLLTQKLPFEASEPMALVYAHLAEIPQSPTKICPEIPSIISQIVLKLMAKNPEDRYQSASGIVNDFEKCLSYLQENQAIPEFQLSKEDFSGKLQIPEKLYGREQEHQTILTAFQRILNGKVELTMVAGYSGTGKSALVSETHRPLANTKGYFIEGKFDQFQRNIPFYAWIQAFKNFVDLLLIENELTLSYWKSIILEVLGDNGAVLTEVIPNLEAIIGKQPPVAELGGQETKNRFNYVMQNFVMAISTKEHPLVIFIDDLQWADLASLNLLRTLVTDTENRHLLCVGAYRDNEVSPTHPLMVTLQKINESSQNINAIHLGNLSKEAVLTMLSETLDFPQNKKLEKLADNILAKTQGNPFFTHQFLKNLYEEELVYFSFETKTWQWDNTKIEKAGFTDNVVDFMAKKVAKLPLQTQHLLELSACIGNQFDFETLQVIAENEDLQPALDCAILEGLIHPQPKGIYKFVHDRVQQAAYSLIPDDRKKQTHLEIGQLLNNSLSKEFREKHLFDITNHYNLASEILDESTKKIAVQLNQQAAQQAKASASFDGMLNYISEAQKLLPENSWKTDYETTLSIYKLLAEAEFFNTNFENSKRYVQEITQYAKSDIDKAEMTVILIEQQTLQADYHEALEIGIKVLKMLGVDVPTASETQEANEKLFQKVVVLLRGQMQAEGIENLPLNQSPEIGLSIRISNLMATTAYIIGNPIFQFFSMKTVELSIKNGNTPYSCKAYADVAFMIAGILGTHQESYEIGKKALGLAHKFGHKGIESQVLIMLGSFILPWNEHIKGGKLYNLDGVKVGLESGELQYAMYNLMSYFVNIMVEGLNLNFIKNEIEERFWEMSIRCHNEMSHSILVGTRWVINTLITNKIKRVPTLQTKLTEEEFEKYMVENNISMALYNYYTYKAQAYYILAHTKEAFEYIQKATLYVPNILGYSTSINYNFFSSLTHLTEYEKTQNSKLLEKVQTNQVQLQKWMENCPENFEHKYLFIQTEYDRVTKAKSWYELTELYEKSIQKAKKYAFKQDVALINECCAKHLRKLGKDKMAQGYLSESYQLYKIWGATAKLEQLEQNYPYLTASTKGTNHSGTATIVGGTTMSGTQNFDAQTILKATTSLSQKIRLKELVREMLQLLTQNSGATKITFLRQENEQWFVHADQENGNPQLSEVIPLVGYEFLPHHLVSFVLRSKMPLILHDASQDVRFEKDIYVSKQKTKAVLVVPVLHKGEFIALIYLENRLNSGVFHAKRYELVNALATQLAISMENTLLYENLEHKVEQRTLELKQSNQELQVTNEELQQTHEELATQRDLLALSNAELEDYQYRISQSIESAKLIQHSILPTTDLFAKHFTAYFVIYLPKDVVSGDFYWFHAENPDEKVLIEADCTGHGVPGAFMTLISHAVLNRVLLVEQERRPVQIMERTHYHMQRILQQEATGNLHGMDISILILRKKAEKWQVDFGGAGQKLHFAKPQEALEIIKGSRRKIGGFTRRNSSFEEHTLLLPQNTILYLSSDGFIDQNNQERKKFSSKAFAELLDQIRQSPLESQQAQLLQALRNHQQDEHQRDDITIIGIQL